MFNKMNSHSPWQPFATSTPLKLNVDKIRNNNLCHIGEVSQSDVPIDYFIHKYYLLGEQNKSNVKKKCNKKTASIYFDVSSSSSSSSNDEDFSKKKRHELKINFVNSKKKKSNSIKTRELEMSKGLQENLQIADCKNNLENERNSIHFLSETKKKCNENLSCRNISSPKKIKAIKRKVKPFLKGNEKSCELALSKINRDFIMEEVLSNQEICCADNRNVKENNNASVCTSEKNQKSCTSIGRKSRNSKKNSSEISKKSAPSKRKQSCLKNENNDVEIFNSSYNVGEKSLGGKKSTCKRSEMENRFIAEKKNKSTIKEKRCIKSDDINSSHQLFSYSQEQELINSLNLNEMNYKFKQEKLDLHKQRHSQSDLKVSKLSYREANEKHIINEVDLDPSVTCSPNKKNIISGEENSGKLKNKNESIKSVSVLESAVAKNTTEFGIVEKLSDNLVARDEKCKLNEIKDFCGSEAVINVDKNLVQVDKRKIINSERIKKKIDNENVESGEMSNEKKVCSDTLPSKKIAGTNFNNKESEKGNDGIADSKNALDALSANVSVFKQLTSLSSFEEFQSGCFNNECWSLKNFKCGILKLNANSHHSNKTMYQNSYLGGVVLKGSMKMKVGKKKLELKEGDMVFVPPLTEWLASNVSDSQAIMYYWCGRFKSH